MKRRKTLASELKIPDRKLDFFLVELANARTDDEQDDTDTFFHLYSGFLPTPPTNPTEVTTALFRVFGERWVTSPATPLPNEPHVYRRGIIAEMRDWLQAIWNAEDDYTAEWRLFQFQSRLRDATTERDSDAEAERDSESDQPSPYDPPSPTEPLSQALAYLRRDFSRLRRCDNPACTTPFFIAAKKEQKLCSNPACTEASQRDYKTKWWREKHDGNGNVKRTGSKVERGKAK